MADATERWAPVPGYEGRYEVSDLGQVRSLTRMVVRSDGRRRTYPGRLLEPYVSESGSSPRRIVTLCRDGGQAPRRVYTLVLEAFVGPRPAGMQGCHNDGDSLNDHLANLRWDTPEGNGQDASEHGVLHNARKTCCPRRHPLAPPNLVVSLAEQGDRSCRACNTARSARRRARAKGVAYDMQHESDLVFARIMARAGH